MLSAAGETVFTLGEAIPNWISAVTSAGTLVAAVAAGIYAKRAADSTHAQATTAKAALEHAKADTKLAEESARIDREAARVAGRRLEEARLDAMLPVIFGTAEYRGSQGVGSSASRFDSARMDGPAAIWKWETVHEGFEVSDSDSDYIPTAFRFAITLLFQNLSEHVAQIDIPERQGELWLDEVIGGRRWKDGEPLFVLPGETERLTWTQMLYSTNLRTDDDLGRPEHAFFLLKFWVRDIGLRVREEYSFNGDLRHFKRDGSRLVVNPDPAYPWFRNVAVPRYRRVYEALDAADEPEAGDSKRD